MYSTIFTDDLKPEIIIFPLKKSNMQSGSISSLQTLVVCSVATTNLIEGIWTGFNSGWLVSFEKEYSFSN